MAPDRARPATAAPCRHISNLLQSRNCLFSQWFSMVFGYGMPLLGSALGGKAGRSWFPLAHHVETLVLPCFFKGSSWGTRLWPWVSDATWPDPDLLQSRNCWFHQWFSMVLNMVCPGRGVPQEAQQRKCCFFQWFSMVFHRFRPGTLVHVDLVESRASSLRYLHVICPSTTHYCSVWNPSDSGTSPFTFRML